MFRFRAIPFLIFYQHFERALELREAHLHGRKAALGDAGAGNRPGERYPDPLEVRTDIVMKFPYKSSDKLQKKSQFHT
jgi:hypothetical protein